MAQEELVQAKTKVRHDQMWGLCLPIESLGVEVQGAAVVGDLVAYCGPGLRSDWEEMVAD